MGKLISSIATYLGISTTAATAVTVLAGVGVVAIVGGVCYFVFYKDDGKIS